MSGRKNARPISRRALALFLSVLAAACVASVVAFKEVNDPRFALGDIVVTGERNTPNSDVLLAAALTKGSNVWLLDVSSAEQRVEALPWIASAHVRRSWPNHVSIVVTERLPIARIFLPTGGAGEEPAQQTALIDASLRVLSVGPQDGLAADLPLFRIVPQPVSLQPGANAGDADVGLAYDAMVQLRALGLGISEVDLKPATGVTVTCANGLRVILGSEDDLAKKVSLFKAIAPKISAPEDVVYVDLRSVRAPTVLYR